MIGSLINIFIGSMYVVESKFITNYFVLFFNVSLIKYIDFHKLKYFNIFENIKINIILFLCIRCFIIIYYY